MSITYFCILQDTVQIQKDLVHTERQIECPSVWSQDECLSPQDHSQGGVLSACAHVMPLHLTNLQLHSVIINMPG